MTQIRPLYTLAVSTHMWIAPNNITIIKLTIIFQDLLVMITSIPSHGPLWLFRSCLGQPYVWPVARALAQLAVKCSTMSEVTARQGDLALRLEAAAQPVLAWDSSSQPSASTVFVSLQHLTQTVTVESRQMALSLQPSLSLSPDILAKLSLQPLLVASQSFFSFWESRVVWELWLRKRRSPAVWSLAICLGRGGARYRGWKWVVDEIWWYQYK